MDKTTRAAFKRAKEYYQTKHYDACKECLSDLLVKDPVNYNALVLQAACLDQCNEDDAVDCFQKAIKIDAKNCLAWQGLLQCMSKNTERYHTTLVHVCIQLINLYTDRQYADKQYTCVRILVEILARYRLEVPCSITGVRDLCKTVFTGQPSNACAIEVMLRLHVEDFLFGQIALLISPTLVDQLLPMAVTLALPTGCSPDIGPVAADEIGRLHSQLAGELGSEFASSTAALTVHLSQLVLSLNDLVHQQGVGSASGSTTTRYTTDQRTGDPSPWSALLRRCDCLDWNGCLGVRNWLKKGYVDLHLFSLHALIAFKAHAYSLCEQVIQRMLVYCREQRANSLMESKDLGVLSTVPLSQLTDFLTPRPVATPLRFDTASSPWLSTGADSNAQQLCRLDVLEEWLTAVRLANTSASWDELPPEIAVRLATHQMQSWCSAATLCWPTVIHTLWAECCLVIGRADFAYQILVLGSKVNSQAGADFAAQVATLLTMIEGLPCIRTRLCAAWTVVELIIRMQQEQNSDRTCLRDSLTAVESLTLPLAESIQSLPSCSSTGRDLHLVANLLVRLQVALTTGGGEAGRCLAGVPAGVSPLDSQRLRLYSIGVQVDPGYHGNHGGLGELLRRTAKMDTFFRQAIEELTRAHELCPNSPSYAYQLALTLCQNNQLNKALDAYTSVDQKRFTQEMWLNYGLIAIRLKKTLQCVPALQKAVILDPRSALYWELLGEAYLLRKSHETAVKTFMRAIQLDVHRPLPHILCGQAYRHLGDSASARQCFQRGLTFALRDLEAKASGAPDGRREQPSAVHLLAMKELIELNLVLASSHLRQGLSGLTIEELTVSLRYLDEIFAYHATHGEMPYWVHHYAGSALSLLGSINDHRFRLHVPPRLLSVLNDATVEKGGDAQTGMVTIATCLQLADIYLACAVKSWSATPGSSFNLDSGVNPALVQAGLFVSTGLHCLSHALFLKRNAAATYAVSDAQASQTSPRSRSDNLLKVAEASFKQAIVDLDKSADADRQLLASCSSADGDVGEVVKIAEDSQALTEQTVKQRIEANSQLRGKAWYGLALVYSQVKDDLEFEIDYCLCQALELQPEITAAGTSIAVRFLHQGRIQLASSLLSYLRASDPENHLVWLASAHLRSLLVTTGEADGLQQTMGKSSVDFLAPSSVVVGAGGAPVNPRVLQDLLQAACLGANTNIALQLTENLFLLLSAILADSGTPKQSVEAQRLGNARSFLRLAVEVTVEALNRATACDPNNFYLWHNRGLLLHLSGLYYPARHCFQRAFILLSELSYIQPEDMVRMKQHFLAQYFLNSVACASPDWSVASSLVELAQDCSATACASLAESCAKAVVFLDHPELGGQAELAQRCLVDEVNRLHQLGLLPSPASSLLDTVPNLPRLQLLMQGRSDPQGLCHQLTLTRTPDRCCHLPPALLFLACLSHLATVARHCVTVQLAQLSSAFQWDYATWPEATSGFEGDSSSPIGRLISAGRQLTFRELTQWAVLNATLAGQKTGSRSSGTAHLCRHLALRPDEPARWTALADWLLAGLSATGASSSHKRLETVCDQWALVVHCVRVAQALPSDTFHCSSMAGLLSDCAQFWLDLTATRPREDVFPLLALLRRSAAFHPATPLLLDRLSRVDSRHCCSSGVL